MGDLGEAYQKRIAVVNSRTDKGMDYGRGGQTFGTLGHIKRQKNSEGQVTHFKHLITAKMKKTDFLN